jgi:hypothetical protein
MPLGFGKKRIAVMPVNPPQSNSSTNLLLLCNIPAKTNCVDIRSELILFKRLMK